MEYKVKVEGLVEEWYLNGEKVKEIKYYENGNKYYEIYYLNGERHRENGPAYQGWYENGNKWYECYYLNGKYHRENGPAYQSWYENGNKRYEEYYLNNKEVSKEEVMKPKKTINIGGKEVSEDTILMALKEYFK
jgi:antitoxin component YwqK of YwqJK toxin-antitoxin module